MRKVLFILTLLFTISINAQEKITLIKAIEHVGVTNVESTEIKAILNENSIAFKKLRKSELSKEEQKNKRRELNIQVQSKILAIIGKDKLKLARAYMKANK